MTSPIIETALLDFVLFSYQGRGQSHQG